MIRLELLACTLIPAVLGGVLVIIGMYCIYQSTGTTNAAVWIGGTIGVCTGILCASLSCIAYPLMRIVELNGNRTQ